MSKNQSARFNNTDFTLIVEENNALDVKIVISKKIAPKAVDRNRVRRIFKEAIRHLFGRGQFTVLVRKNLKDLKMTDIRDQIKAITGAKGSFSW